MSQRFARLECPNCGAKDFRVMASDEPITIKAECRCSKAFYLLDLAPLSRFMDADQESGVGVGERE